MADFVDRARAAVTDRAELPGMSLMEHLAELRTRIIHSAVYLIIGFAVVIMSLVPSVSIRLFSQSAFMALFVLLLIEGSILGFRLRRAIDTQFPPEKGPYEGRRGAVFYGIMRAFQLRRLRLPKPQVAPGGKIPPAPKS